MRPDLSASAWPWLAALFFGVLPVLVIADMYPIPAAVLVAGLAAARWRWHRRGVRLVHYFTTRRIVLTLLLLVAGIGVHMALLGSGGALAIMTASGVAVAAGAFVIAILFEHAGDTMKSIMDLVPQDQQAALGDFLGAGAPAGKFADFSDLDQHAVVAEIKQRVIGQDSIVDSVVSTAFRRARMRRPHRPVATFLFVGSTGSGKTELAKALAGSLFGGEKLIRVDCSELSSEYTASRLVGPPPGYVGHEEGSDFCRQIGRLGTGIILLDEIEKAHPTVVRVMMSLLDEGRITEQSSGQTYSAQGFIIIATSNAAAREIAQVVDAGSEDESEQRAAVKDALRQAGFLPEILARIDSVFPFGSLSRAAVAEVVGLFLRRFAADAGIELASVDAGILIDLVTRHEALADYGIREVIRLIESAVVDGLLDARDAGFAKAAIRVHGEAVQVEGMR